MAKKKSVDLFGEDQEVRPMNEFDALLNTTSLVSTRSLRAGDRFRGEILAVTGQEAFISTGTPTDAVMPFVSASKESDPKSGDFVDVVVLRVREGEILVKPVGSSGVASDNESLEDAYDMELPVEGTVLEAVKGGFRVKVQTHKAFCPISQIDFRCTNPDDYIGKKFEFIITKFERGRDLVVSRRKILETERALVEDDFQRDAKIGEIYSATVIRLEPYGAFAKLENGVEGLIPISEVSFGRIGHPGEILSLNQSVQVKLLRVQAEGDRLKVSFSLKQGGSIIDPWLELKIGTQYEGLVERKEPYGLFVHLTSGVTGLLPRSAWRDATEGGDYEHKRKGDKVKVRIERIDLETHKLSLSLPREDEDESWRDAAATTQSASFGTLGDLLKNAKPGVKR